MAISLALIGFGEAAWTFARAAQWGARARAFDLLPSRRAAMQEAGVTPCDTPADALRDAQLVLSLVTADQALSAACAYASYLEPGAFWFDMNSVAPGTKRAAADAVEQAGAHYVDVAVLAPVEPARLAVPLFVSGREAEAGAARLGEAGFTNCRTAGDEVGRASAIKMIRSVMVKGVEALTDEMMCAAQAAGVTDEVLASLDASEKAWDWTKRAAYNIERMDSHGLRRAAEMEEAARTLLWLGVDPVMTRGTIQRQRDRGSAAGEERAA